MQATAAVTVVLLVPGCLPRGGVCAALLPTWAPSTPIAGLPNLHRVSEDLFRGAQPTETGLALLPGIGIKTVVNLCPLDQDRKWMAGSDLQYVGIPMLPWRCIDADIARFLSLVTDPGTTPVFVHCRRGADRTGVMCACYRVVVCGWPKEQAIREMTEGNYGFHSMWQNLVTYVRELDVYAMRSRIGLEDAQLASVRSGRSVEGLP